MIADVLDPASYQVSVYALPPLVACVGAAALAVGVVAREGVSRVSLAMAAMAVSAGIWQLGFAGVYLAASPAVALFWVRVAYLGVPFIPSSAYVFAVGVLRLRGRRALVGASLGLSFLFFVAALGTRLLVSGVTRYWWGYYPRYGGLGIPFVLFFTTMMVLGAREYLREFRDADTPRKRERTKWLIVAFVISALAAVDFLAKFGVAVYPFGYLPLMGFLAVSAWTIGRYRLVDLTPSFVADEIISTMPDLLLVCDGEGHIRLANELVTEVLGYRASDIAGWPLTRLAGDGESAERLAMALRGGMTGTFEALLRARGGELVAADVGASVRADRAGGHMGVVVIARDIRSRKAAEEQLRQSEQRYALAASGANDGLWDWDLVSRRAYYSPRWRAILGCAPADVHDTFEDWLDRVHPDDRERVQSALGMHLDGASPHFEDEHRMRHREGHYVWVLTRGLAVRGGEGQATRIAGSMADITARKEAEQQLLHDAFHDSLTGLQNRALFVNRLSHAVERAQRRSGDFAVLFLDLDRFKVVNDSLGHGAGDRLLQGIAGRLKNCLRPGDTVARLGGDEFTILLEDLDSREAATTIADRVHEALAAPFEINGEEIVASTSIGIAFGREGYIVADEILRDADIAMYRAKAMGAARSIVFDEGMRIQTVARFHLETELRHAVDRGELVVHYQPIVTMPGHELHGFEALVRWNHPVLGLIQPGQFIAVAEETGAISGIGQWVLREGCRQLKRWHDQFPGRPLTLSVNLSPRQLSAPELVDQVQSAIAESGVRPESIRLEITESALMGDVEGAATVLNRLKALGVNLYVDDFGTGYSSLSYLQRFPVSTLKIDRSFVNRMAHNAQDAEIVRTIVTLAHSLGLDVIAEGVETTEQGSQLTALQCQFAQGHLYSEAIDAAAAETLLRTKRPLSGVRQPGHRVTPPA